MKKINPNLICKTLVILNPYFEFSNEPIIAGFRIWGQWIGRIVSTLEGLLSAIAPSGVCGMYWKNVRTMAHVKLPGVGFDPKRKLENSVLWSWGHLIKLQARHKNNIMRLIIWNILSQFTVFTVLKNKENIAWHQRIKIHPNPRVRLESGLTLQITPK